MECPCIAACCPPRRPITTTSSSNQNNHSPPPPPSCAGIRNAAGFQFHPTSGDLLFSGMERDYMGNDSVSFSYCIGLACLEGSASNGRACQRCRCCCTWFEVHMWLLCLLQSRRPLPLVTPLAVL